MIKRKFKLCSGCNVPSILWTSNPPMCKACAVGNKPIPRTKRSKPIPNISEKQLSRLAKYRPIRDKFLKDHPVCQYPGCRSRKVELHHASGRIGDLLFDVRHFRSLCSAHHRECELSPEKAKELGLSESRLNKS